MLVSLKNVARNARYARTIYLIPISGYSPWPTYNTCFIKLSLRIQYPLKSLAASVDLPIVARTRTFHWQGPIHQNLQCNPTSNSFQRIPPTLLSSLDHENLSAKTTPTGTKEALRAEPVPTNDPQSNKQPEGKKLTLWQRAKKEIVHYYHGFRLLGLEIRIATGICFRLLRGHALSRRERKQLVRTVADIIRLVPFAIFIIVPFMEFLLPFYLKFFPFMLPSTFKDKTSESEKIRQRLKAKLELTRFLQETLHHTTGTALEASGSPTVDEFQDFLKKVQESGQPATAEEITRFSKLFEDQVTLESLEMKQLKMLCQLLSLPTIGPSNLLRFQIWLRVRQLKAEDRLIAKEGLDKIPVWELQSLCQERGMRSLGLTEERLRSQLAQWLALHLEKNVPVTLLLFSRALHVTQASSVDLPLKEAIAQLPPSASEQAAALALESTPHAELDPRAKMELLRKEQASIKAARVQRDQELAELKSTSQAEGKTEPTTDEKLVDKAPPVKGLPKEELQSGEAIVDQAPVVAAEKTEVLNTVTDTNKISPISTSEPPVTIAVPDEKPAAGAAMRISEAPAPVAASEPATAVLDKTKEEDTEITVHDLNQIETAISESSDALQEEVLDGLKEEVAETTKRIKQHEAALVSVDRPVDKRTRKAANRLAARVGQMIGEMDTMIEKLNDERKQLLKNIELREVHVKHATEPSEQTEMLDAIQADHQRVVDINDLLLALRRIQKVPDDTKWEKILKVLDEDQDGKIELQHVLSVVELLGTENVKLSSKEVKRVLEMVDNEHLAAEMGSGESTGEPTDEKSSTEIRKSAVSAGAFQKASEKPTQSNYNGGTETPLPKLDSHSNTSSQKPLSTKPE
ncbi:letm1 and EF-hand domain-containing protein 1, mitochondrial [Clonorchis sinensis]|uniref:Mitochondrial proton/calcium exchanger protein n=1 Tax=Clonorchis sinensis TaxID=79923 RepID=A0A8T1MP46_CLOSI|nr:letm1 and EF-hand domain-containing protein 1, mitochondrial [Clonorchis sinensis]